MSKDKRTNIRPGDTHVVKQKDGVAIGFESERAAKNAASAVQGATVEKIEGGRHQAY